MEEQELPPDDPSSRPVGLERDVHPEFLDVIARTGEVMDASGIAYVIMGGIAVSVWGRPRYTHDIDVFVRPDDAEPTLRAFADAGFETEKRDPHWLFKAFKDGVLVDIIFRTTGEIYLDDEMHERAVRAEFKGVPVKLICREDLIVIKAIVNDEGVAYHWYDALALIAAGDIDWEYLLRRSRRGARRMLSLLLYALSNDLLVPSDAIERLNAMVWDGRATSDDAHVGSIELRAQHTATDDYLAAQIHDALAHHPRVSQQDIDVVVAGERVTLSGIVPTQQRREAAVAVTSELAPGFDVIDRLDVASMADASVVELS